MRTSAAHRAETNDFPPSIDDMVDLVTRQPDCFYCGVPLAPTTFSGDHAQPLKRGGTNALSNWRICCKQCNGAKGGMTEEEFVDLLALMTGWEDGGRVTLARLRVAGNMYR
jgi:5-methylcytosine-specific restriction endonuclease McrA